MMRGTGIRGVGNPLSKKRSVVALMERRESGSRVRSFPVERVTVDNVKPIMRTNPSFVYFHDALEFVHEWMLRHGEAQPMKHEPCGLVRTALPIERPHHAKQLMCTHALLA